MKSLEDNVVEVGAVENDAVSWRAQKPKSMRSSLQSVLGLLGGMTDSRGVVWRPFPSPLALTMASSDREVPPPLCALAPLLGAAAATVRPFLHRPAPATPTMRADGLPVSCADDFRWSSLRERGIFSAAFLASKASQAFCPRSRLALSNVLVNDTMQIEHYLNGAYWCKLSEVAPLQGLARLEQAFGCCFSGEEVLRISALLYRAGCPTTKPGLR